MNQSIPEVRRKQHLSFVTQNHAKLSAFAREQYSTSGHGLLLVAFVPHGQCAIRYAKPAEVEGDAFQMVAAYNPDEEYLVAMSEPNEPIVIYHFKLASGTPCRDEVGEPVFNLFLYVIDGLVKEVGTVRHYFAGTDTEKKSFLQSQVQSDFARAKRYRLPSSLIVIGPGGRRTTGIRYGAFLELAQSGKQLMLFEQAFRDFSASQTPLYCITAIVNGVPKMDVLIRQ